MAVPELSVKVTVKAAEAPVSNEELPVIANDVPVTATTTVPETDPDVTVTVIFLFVWLEPGINVAVAKPVLEFVVADTPLNTPEDAENVTAVLVNALLEESFTRAEIVTPVVLSAELNVRADAKTSTVAADEVVVVVVDELDPTSPPPPQANKRVTKKSAIHNFKERINIFPDFNSALITEPPSVQ